MRITKRQLRQILRKTIKESVDMNMGRAVMEIVRMVSARPTMVMMIQMGRSHMFLNDIKIMSEEICARYGVDCDEAVELAMKQMQHG
jgi:hypothetical protein